MTNAKRAKGVGWESALRDFFRSLGIAAYRPAQEGFRDVGDLHGLDPFIGQAKNWADTVAALRVGTDAAEVQAMHAGRDYGVNFVKRARANVSRGYAVMSVRTFALVLKRLQMAETTLAYCSPDLYQAHLIGVREHLDAAIPEGKS